MSRRRKTTRIVKSAVPEGMETPCEVVADQLETLAREGAREMLMTTPADEVDAYLGRGRYERGGGFRGYRNGTSPRRLTLGSGTVALDTPRVRDIPPGQTPFESKIIRKYPRVVTRSTRPLRTCSSKGWPPAISNPRCVC